ncbi:MAG: hypothetical protein OXD42_08765 [Rhodospirillaceae bacterium]|nr:hypothetical protein [Rhodospirillaceae bacterium]
MAEGLSRFQPHVRWSVDHFFWNSFQRHAFVAVSIPIPLESLDNGQVMVYLLSEGIVWRDERLVPFRHSL